MKTGLWVSIVGTAAIIAYTLGFVVSKGTGVEPGFFEKAESGGYGVSGGDSAVEGVSEEMANYYNELKE